MSPLFKYIQDHKLMVSLMVEMVSSTLPKKFQMVYTTDINWVVIP